MKAKIKCIACGEDFTPKGKAETCPKCKKIQKVAEEKRLEYKRYTIVLKRLRWGDDFIVRVKNNIKYFYESGDKMLKDKDMVEFVCDMVKDSHSDTMRYNKTTFLGLMSMELYDEANEPSTDDHVNGMVSTIKELARLIISGDITNGQEVQDFLNGRNVTIRVSKHLNSNGLKVEQNKNKNTSIDPGKYYDTCEGIWHIKECRFLSREEFIRDYGKNFMNTRISSIV